MSEKIREYKDIDIDFLPHPVRKDILKKTGFNAVAQSIRNLILLNHYEKPFHPEIGSNVRKLLFENANPVTAAILEREIVDTITNFEPRVQLKSVIVIDDSQNNGFDIVIEYFQVNVAEPITISLFLERLR